MSGIPIHSLEPHLETLVAKGHIVAIAEQVELPKEAKGIVKRKIVRIVSPATLGEKKTANNFFASISQVNQIIGLCLIDFSTGEIITTEMETEKQLLNELFKKSPSEILTSKKVSQTHASLLEELHLFSPFRLTVKQECYFDHNVCYPFLTNHFQVLSLDSFGLKGMVPSINATAALLSHLENDLCQDITPFQSIRIENISSYVSISHETQKHLDLIHSSSNHPKATLFALLNKTKTPMGARLLKNWICHPLLSCEKIEERLNAIDAFLQAALSLDTILPSICDLEKLAMRVKTGTANPRDLLQLSLSLEQIFLVKQNIEKIPSPLMSRLLPHLFDFSPLTKKIQQALIDTPPIKISEGGIFRKGYLKSLDELKDFKEKSELWLTNYQNHLRESLGIKTLKIGYNKAFGYFIETSLAKASKMPPSFERRQTLINGERFTSKELKEYAYKIFHAEEKMIQIEQEHFLRLRKEMSENYLTIQKTAKAVAIIDVVHSLAKVAKEYQYTKPLVNTSNCIDIQEGRHPILENLCNENALIPNDLYLDSSKESLLLITGPNMAGKSTFIRQTALLVVLAQIGSFIPAKMAKIGVVDKIFSRIGASDNLPQKQSTFMVEMIEVANILHAATKNSLVILDEIGRGTSTYDGIAIASAVAEKLLKLQVKTLFATHFWELTNLANTHRGVKNYRVDVKEHEQGIAFLYKILPGGTDKSYGIHVAKLAGLPSDVLEKAKKRLIDLEKQQIKSPSFEPISPPFAKKEVAIMQKIKQLNLNKTTPLEALQFLAQIQHGL